MRVLHNGRTAPNRAGVFDVGCTMYPGLVVRGAFAATVTM
jgi:hypothetical protein